MGHRDSIPLNPARHVAQLEGILDCDDPDKAVASHLSLGTGARGDTICHTHKTWFAYDEDGDLYYQIPNRGPCRKYGHHEPCGDCNRSNRSEYKPKTPAGGGRRILIPNEYTNPVTREKEYFGLRDRVENYFELNNDAAPDGSEFGYDMIQGSHGDGLSLQTLNDWIREIAAESPMKAQFREDRLRAELEPDRNEDGEITRTVEEKIEKGHHGVNANGTRYPDVTSHDLRATFCTQLMRNDYPGIKAKTLTGHKNIATLERYVKFAEKELSGGSQQDAY